MNQFPTEGGGEPPAMPLTPEQMMALAALAGSIHVDIEMKDGKKFELAVSVPTGAGSPYSFKLTETASGKQATLADFEFTDSEDFSIEVNMPSIETSTTTITAGFNLKESKKP